MIVLSSGSHMFEMISGILYYKFSGAA